MPHSQLVRFNQATLHYVHTLRAAYQRHISIIDPDYAHQNDREAWQKIRRDAVIAHAIQLRRNAVAGTSWQVVPATDSDTDKRVAVIIDSLLREIRRFQQSRYNLAEAIFRGSSWAFVRGARKNLRIRDDVDRTWWVPNALCHADRWRFRITRTDSRATPIEDKRALELEWEMFSIARGDWEKLTNPEWFIRHDVERTEETLGYGRGLLQEIYFFWRAKEIALAQGLAGLERWAQGLIQVGIDGAREGSDEDSNTNEDIVDEWITQLSKQRSEHILVGDKNDDITVHQGPGQGHEMVKDFLQYFDRSLTQLILTSVLPTGGGGETGSMARAETEADQMERTFSADREGMSETLTDTVVALVWDRNIQTIRELLQSEGLNDEPRMPSFQITQQPREDPKENIQIVTQALNSNIPLLKEEVYKKLGFTMPNVGDEIIEPQQQPGFPGGGGPGGGLPFVAQYIDAPANGNGHSNGGALIMDSHCVPARYGQGEPCKQGETAARSGCTPAEGESKGKPGDNIESEISKAIEAGDFDRLIEIEDERVANHPVKSMSDSELLKSEWVKPNGTTHMFITKSISPDTPGFRMNWIDKDGPVGHAARANLDEIREEIITERFNDVDSGTIDKILSSAGRDATVAMYGEGQPCKPGETAAKTGCIPKSGDGEKKEGKARPEINESKFPPELVTEVLTPEEDAALDARFKAQFVKEGNIEKIVSEKFAERRDRIFNELEKPRQKNVRSDDDIADHRGVDKLYPGKIKTVHKEGLPESTLLEHTDENGEFTPERQVLHDQVRSFFTDHIDSVPDDEQPVAVLTMGGTGSGKSTMLEAMEVAEAQYVSIDADSIKKQLPEYRESIAAGAVDAAGVVHGESSVLAKDIIDESMSTRKNMIIDGTGANLKKMNAMVDKLIEAGFRVRTYMPHIRGKTDSLDDTLVEAQARIDGRGRRGGRILKRSIWRPIWEKVPNSFVQLSKRPDIEESILFDNSGGKDDPIRPVWKFNAGKAEVLDQKFVDMFQKHAAISAELHPVQLSDEGDDPVRYEDDKDKELPPNITKEDTLKTIVDNWKKALDRQEEDSANVEKPGILDVRQGEDDHIG